MNFQATEITTAVGKRQYVTVETLWRLVDEAVAAERERIERDVASLHMAQSVNNQNYPRAWHDGIDAALEVIRGA